LVTEILTPKLKISERKVISNLKSDLRLIKIINPVLNNFHSLETFYFGNKKLGGETGFGI